jgi:hypothetical protein
MIIAAVGVALSGYYIFFEDRDDLIYLLASSLLILVVAYVFQHQIDQIAIRGVPQAIDPAMRSMLIHTAPQFARLSEDRRKMMEDRMQRWILQKEFISKQEHDIPEDIKFILAYYAILLTLHQEPFLYKGIDRIAFYQHPFLSPAHPDDVHIGEVEATDGTMILSFPHLLKGHFEKGYYNIALHCMAVAYQQCYMTDPIRWEADIWERLESVSSISKGQLEAYIGLPLTDPWPVAVHHQVTFRGAHIEQVLQRLPQLVS